MQEATNKSGKINVKSAFEEKQEKNVEINAPSSGKREIDPEYKIDSEHEIDPVTCSKIENPCNIPKESTYKFQELGLGRSMLITPYVFQDSRGEFIETYHYDQFTMRLGLDFVQDCTSVSCIHCLRGLHGDFRTWKLIHCPKGSVLACIVDLNPSSPTYFKSRKVTISDKNRQMLLVPPGFGNSFLVMEDNTVYSYKKTTYFRPGAEFTLRYDADGTGIKWPENNEIVLSKRDIEAPKSREIFEATMRSRKDLENNPFLPETPDES